MNLGLNPHKWPQRYYDDWLERAAIMEHDSGMSQDEALRAAEADVRRAADWEAA